MNFFLTNHIYRVCSSLCPTPLMIFATFNKCVCIQYSERFKRDPSFIMPIDLENDSESSDHTLHMYSRIANFEVI